MAIMIPAECDPTRRPMSEQIVFEAIRKNLSDDWSVFHSFDYVTRDQRLKRWDGEIDFLLYHPVKGFLVLEVKGGAISYRNGHWYQEDREIDPVNQAKRNKYAVRQLLEERLNRPSRRRRFPTDWEERYPPPTSCRRYRPSLNTGPGFPNGSQVRKSSFSC